MTTSQPAHRRIPSRFAMEIVAATLGRIAAQALHSNGVVSGKWFLWRFRAHLIRNLERRGATRAAIGELLDVSERTVRTYLEKRHEPAPWHPLALAILDSLDEVSPTALDAPSLTLRLDTQGLAPTTVLDTLHRLERSGLVEREDSDRFRVRDDPHPTGRDELIATLCRMRIYQRPGISGARLAEELGLDLDTELVPVLRDLRDRGQLLTNDRGLTCLDVHEYVLNTRNDPKFHRFALTDLLVHVAGTLRAAEEYDDARRRGGPDAPPAGAPDGPGFSVVTVDFSAEREQHPAFRKLRSFARNAVAEACALRRELPLLEHDPDETGRRRRRAVLLLAQFVNVAQSAIDDDERGDDN